MAESLQRSNASGGGEWSSALEVGIAAERLQRTSAICGTQIKYVDIVVTGTYDTAEQRLARRSTPRRGRAEASYIVAVTRRRLKHNYV